MDLLFFVAAVAISLFVSFILKTNIVATVLAVLLFVAMIAVSLGAYSQTKLTPIDPGPMTFFAYGTRE